MMNVLIISVTAAAIAHAISEILTIVEKLKRFDYKRSEARAESAMEDEAYRREADMSEGFANIMSFSVNGNDGFGGV